MRGAREAHLTLDRASVSSSDDWESDVTVRRQRRRNPAPARRRTAVTVQVTVRLRRKSRVASRLHLNLLESPARTAAGARADSESESSDSWLVSPRSSYHINQPARAGSQLVPAGTYRDRLRPRRPGTSHAGRYNSARSAAEPSGPCTGSTTSSMLDRMVAIGAMPKPFKL